MITSLDIGSPLKRWLGYSLLLLFSCTLFIAAFFPASTAWHILQPRLNLPGELALEVTQQQGTVWFGSASVLHNGRLTADVEWRWQGLSFLDQSLDYDVTVSSHGLLLRSTLSISPEQLSLTQLNGEIDGQFISTMAYPQRLIVEGQIHLGSVSTRLEAGWFSQLEGSLRWNGGLVSLGPDAFSVAFPPVEGSLYMKESVPTMHLEAANGQQLAAEIKPDGWFYLRSTPAAGSANNETVQSVTYEERLWW